MILQELLSLCFEEGPWKNQTSTITTHTSQQSIPHGRSWRPAASDVHDKNQFAVPWPRVLDYTDNNDIVWFPWGSSRRMRMQGPVYEATNQTTETITRLLVKATLSINYHMKSTSTLRLECVIPRHGMPERLLSDWGKNILLIVASSRGLQVLWY